MSDSDLSDGIVPDELPKHSSLSATLRKDFKPWHRVRKQFIRERQWNHEIRFLAQRYLRREVDRPVRCLVLPGEDLLDVRCVWRGLQEEGCELRFLGFNNSAMAQERRRHLDVAENAVTQLSKICKDSHVISDAFQNIARKNTHAFQSLRSYGPFDVVNLDLCDSLIPRGKPGEMEANYSALHQLLCYQLERQRTPWLLFATTQVDRETAHQPELNKLAQALRDNCNQHGSFADALEKLIPRSAYQSAEHALDISALDANQLTNVFGVVLGKWLMRPLAQSSPRCSVKLLPSYRYTIKPDSNVGMLSVGFLIIPHFEPPVDATGVSTVQTNARQFPGELESAIDLVSVAESIRDVDGILAADSELKNKLTNSSADLLADASYDREEYLRWVAAGELEAKC
ncbi:MAG: hypothetical protein AAB370_09535 [Verrucomicrobiota bacterium]